MQKINADFYNWQSLNTILVYSKTVKNCSSCSVSEKPYATNDVLGSYSSSMPDLRDSLTGDYFAMNGGIDANLLWLGIMFKKYINYTVAEKLRANGIRMLPNISVLKHQT